MVSPESGVKLEACSAGHMSNTYTIDEGQAIIPMHSPDTCHAFDA